MLWSYKYTNGIKFIEWLKSGLCDGFIQRYPNGWIRPKSSTRNHWIYEAKRIRMQENFSIEILFLSSVTKYWYTLQITLMMHNWNHSHKILMILKQNKNNLNKKFMTPVIYTPAVRYRPIFLSWYAFSEVTFLILANLII